MTQFKSLALPINFGKRDYTQLIRQKRLDLINEAISWQGDTQQGSFIYQWLWYSGDHSNRVGLGKYGKEYYLNTIKWKNGNVGNNPNDMRPTIEQNGAIKEFDGSFEHVFRFFQDAYKKDENALMVLGCLMVRGAFLIDHQRNTDGHYRYNPPLDVMDYLNNTLHEWDGISIDTYLHYLDAIAWNEDVKYHTLGYDILSGIGRQNNLLTYAHIIAVLLGEAELYKLCANFSRPPVGVSPITKKLALKAFPNLNPY